VPTPIARTYAYDAENRLIAIRYLNKPSAYTLFAYDGLDRRIAAVESGNPATYYTWCGASLCQALTSIGAVMKRYLLEGEVSPTANSGGLGAGSK
jgi:YD repeat-containing protein